MRQLTTKYQVTKNFLLLGILVTGLLSAIIGILAFFGQNMGTFVISLSDELAETGIVLSDNKEFNTATQRLLVNPVNGAYPVTYSYIKVEDAVNTDADYQDPDNLTYIAYTFYILNEGKTMVDVRLTVDMVSVTNNVDGCIRLMIIENGEYQSIYYKEDDNRHPKDETPYEIAQTFVSDTRICDKEFKLFRPGDVKKYTLIIWLEGWDRDCTDTVKGGQLKMEMMFSCAKEYVIDDEENN